MEEGRRATYGEGVTLSLAPPAVGPLVRQWRQRRRRSQLDLALDVGVSTRHLSFVETGRSRPSPELLLALADRLEVPLRERNTFLLAAGYAPRFRQTALDDASMAGVRAALQRLLERHDPYPGAVIDRTWNVVDANAAAGRLLAALPASALRPMSFASACTPTGWPATPATSRSGGRTCGHNCAGSNSSPVTRGWWSSPPKSASTRRSATSPAQPARRSPHRCSSSRGSCASVT